jgi:ABC-type multidrug transport system ATPase subunit
MIQGFNYEAKYRELSKRLKLDLGHKYPAILSGGNKRKLCTALTMVTSPKVAFFDEPTVGLDPVARRALLDLIKRRGRSVLFTTHRLDEAEYLCDRVAILKRGKILFDGDIEQVKKQYLRGFSGDQVTCYGLVLLKEPQGNIMENFPYLELEQEDVR